MTSTVVGRAHRAVAVTFFAHALLLASWPAQLPALQAHLHLDDAEVGKRCSAHP